MTHYQPQIFVPCSPHKALNLKNQWAILNAEHTTFLYYITDLDKVEGSEEEEEEEPEPGEVKPTKPIVIKPKKDKDPGMEKQWLSPALT